MARRIAEVILSPAKWSLVWIFESVFERGNEHFLFTYDDIQPVCRTNDPRLRVAALMESYRQEELRELGKPYHINYIAPWDLRDLRRTAATIMARLGHPLHVVDKILNHAGGHSGTGRTLNSVARIYIKHEFLEERRQALQDLGEYIRKLLNK